MLSCIVGKSYVNTVDYKKEEIKKWSEKGILKCPVCESKLIYRHGEIKLPHFAHEKDCECTYTFYENISKEHGAGTVLLYNWLKTLENVKEVKFQHYIPETKQIPDIYFEIENKRFVIEYQCTPILKSEYDTRHELYKLNDINDIWIAGFEKYCEDDFRPINNGVVYCHNHRIKECELFFNNNNFNYYLNAFNENLFICNKDDIEFDSKKKIKLICFVDKINKCWIEDGLILNINYKIKDYISNGGRYHDFKTNKWAVLNDLEILKSEMKKLNDKIQETTKENNELKDLTNFTIKCFISSKNIFVYEDYNNLIEDARKNKFRFIVYKLDYFDMNILTKIILDEQDMNKPNIYLYFSKFDLRNYNDLYAYHPKSLRIIKGRA